MRLKTLVALTTLCAAASMFASAQQATAVRGPSPSVDEGSCSAPESTGPAPSRSRAPASNKAPVLDLSLSSARIRAIVDGSAAPRFDGSSSSSDSAPDLVPAGGIGAHVQGTVRNVGVLRNWNK